MAAKVQHFSDLTKFSPFYLADDAINAGTTAVAKIAYVGSNNGESVPFNHGLAMALNDVTGGEETYLFHWKTEDTSGKHSYRPTKSSSFSRRFR